MFDNSKKYTKPHIGLYSVGLKAYWAQFEELRERLINYGKFIGSKLSSDRKVYNFG